MHLPKLLCAAVSASVITLSASCALTPQQVQAAPYSALPDLGTAGVLGLTVQKEQQLGEFFMRAARGMMPIIDDPVMDEYLNSVGNKLLLHANNVNFPFEFFLVNDTTLNASAFLGGKVRVNTGLFIYSQTEDEFASVLAHEISHVTQRHIARFLESQVRRSTMTVASVIGAIAMSIINPTMGMAAMSTAMGVSMQSRIDFTRDNEYEADRIGLDLLYQAGFNPEGMTDMFRHLLSMQGSINPAFTLLIDHPLSEIRIAEAQNRVQQLPKRKNSTNPDFYLAKARVDVRYVKHDDLNALLAGIIADPNLNSYYKNYAAALICHALKDYSKANSFLEKLPADNLFVIDLRADLNLAQKNYAKAISALQSALKKRPRSAVITLNLANTYLQSGRAQNCVDLLENFTDRHPNHILALDLLSQAYAKTGDQCSLLQSRGELFALYANYGKSIYMFNQALNTCSNNLIQERIKARVAQLANQRAFDEALNKSM